jgi:hypothetical protein
MLSSGWSPSAAAGRSALYRSVWTHPRVLMLAHFP